ncbi:DUF2938 domain-containing protein [Thaumasiovibrio subtropicus]|uniref:DUF2938 domain-containing protein n=1 Tax=Thaumasiovibrio subtropicus TaxID=1891207 RepID=UPI000B34EEBC|nr:DUF2938 domain-containing protein [Thaumasiovibrio subtropicus]
MSLLIDVIVLGVIATFVMDSWAWIQLKLFNIPSLSYPMVGRWLGHLPQGRLIHNTIADAKPIQGESIIGWTAHYLIGVLFAGLYACWLTPAGLAAASFSHALGFGIVTVIAPYFLLQPCLGVGLMARRTPRPNIMRLRSLVAHASFGCGLYIGAKILALY